MRIMVMFSMRIMIMSGMNRMIMPFVSFMSVLVVMMTSTSRHHT
jgi:hypothetical protein